MKEPTGKLKFAYETITNLEKKIQDLEAQAKKLKAEKENILLQRNYWTYRCGFSESMIPMFNEELHKVAVKKGFLKRKNAAAFLKEPQSLFSYYKAPSPESLKKFGEDIKKMFKNKPIEFTGQPHQPTESKKDKK